VVNGVAWNEQQRRLYVTGKRWPRIYQVWLLEGAWGGQVWVWH